MFFKQLFFSAILMSLTVAVPAQGLKFKGMEYNIRERTSYTVFSNEGHSFRGSLSINFKFSPQKINTMGYVLRIIDKSREGRVWNMSYSREGGDSAIVRFNVEGKYSAVKAVLPVSDIKEMQWVPIHIKMDFVRDSIHIGIGSHRYKAANVPMPEKVTVQVQFGKSAHMIDVPSFAIRELSISGRDKSYYFPLNEASSERVHDVTHRIRGRVENPEWMIRESFLWTHETSMSSQTEAANTYDAYSQKFYYLSSDRLTTYDVINKTTTVTSLNGKCPVSMKQGMCYPDGNGIIVYGAYGQEVGESPTVAKLDLDTFSWEILSYSRTPFPLYHHCSFTDPQTGHLNVFGGYGNSLYSNRFLELTDEGEWKERWASSGIHPRYFTSCGQDGNGEYLYIFGGMGNESGEQIVGRRYYYDLHKVRMSTGECTKIWETEMPGMNVVPGRDIFIIGDFFYALCYPEYISNSHIKLYKISLIDGSYTVYGDEIPIVSDKIGTNANLHFDSKLEKFFITTQVTEDDVKSKLDIYSISYPLKTKADVRTYTCWDILYASRIILLLLISGFLTRCFIVRRKNRKMQQIKSREVADKVYSEPASRANAIFTFGALQINDRDGKEIELSTQLTNIFLMLIKYGEQGISAQRMNNLFWPDKEAPKAKNSRGVAINNLRKKLENVEGLSISFNEKHYKLILGEETYCDCLCVQKTLKEINEGNGTEDDKAKILAALSRGKFLQGVEDSLFDTYKANMENLTIAFMERENEKHFTARDNAGAIEISSMLLASDPLSENALKYMVRSFMKLKRKEDALSCYSAFSSNYRTLNGEAYPVPFEKLVAI